MVTRFGSGELPLAGMGSAVCVNRRVGTPLAVQAALDMVIALDANRPIGILAARAALGSLRLAGRRRGGLLLVTCLMMIWRMEFGD